MRSFFIAISGSISVSLHQENVRYEYATPAPDAGDDDILAALARAVSGKQ